MGNDVRYRNIGGPSVALKIRLETMEGEKRNHRLFINFLFTIPPVVGLTMHTSTRSEFIIQMVHRIGISIDYSKVLWLET